MLITAYVRQHAHTEHPRRGTLISCPPIHTKPFSLSPPCLSIKARSFYILGKYSGLLLFSLFSCPFSPNTPVKRQRTRCTMSDVVSDDDFSLNPGAGGGGSGEEEENDEPTALRAALHFSIGEICSVEEGKLPMTGGAVSTLAEVDMHHTCRTCRRDVQAARFVRGVPRSDIQTVKKNGGTEDNTPPDTWPPP